MVRRGANRICRAAWVGRSTAIAAGALVGVPIACVPLFPGELASVHTAPAPSATERYCAWFGTRRGDILFFGQSAFWSAFEAAGREPRADLEQPGPTLIGRFDLRREQLLQPIVVGRPGDRSGVWDVLVHPEGRLWFTTYFEPAGVVDLSTGGVRRLGALGTGLNELAPGPDGSVLATRYTSGPGQPGAVVVIDPDGRRAAELPLRSPAGFTVAPKSVAYDPLRGEIWVTTDLLPEEPGGTIRHDTYVLDLKGNEKRRIAHPEIQFVAFGDDGTGYMAEVEAGQLFLRVVPAPGEHELRLLLDDAFVSGADFAQDIQLANGSAVVSRWSGWVHVAERSGAVRSLRLPSLEGGGLYYTAVLVGERLCATHCGGVTVVCSDLP
ncbi:MAG: hypothetical protein V3U03_13000 [Myxococcota bacterium]